MKLRDQKESRWNRDNRFSNYADGYNYLGCLALDRGAPEEAIEQFARAVEIGRSLFPKRLGKKRYWKDLDTRPYIRGLIHLDKVQFPQSAGMLAGLSSAEPANYDESSDHNAGVDLLRRLKGYLEERSQRARRFFQRALLANPVTEQLAEMAEIVKRWKAQRQGDGREAFRKMKAMRTPEFARRKARELAPLLLPGHGPSGNGAKP